MGQANRRGSFETRRAQAVQFRAAVLEAVKAQAQDNPVAARVAAFSQAYGDTMRAVRRKRDIEARREKREDAKTAEGAVTHG